MRRALSGVALVLAFVPLGWVASAAFVGDPARQHGGAAGADRFRPAAARAPRGPRTSLAAHIPARRVRVYARPSPTARRRVLRARELDGRLLPLVVLVNRRRPGWLRVQLPTRPNHSTGWIRSRAATLRVVEWRLRVDLSARRVFTFRGKRLISVHRIAIGEAVTPTPRGRYYLTDLVRPPNPDGLYGTYAFGLSAHSPVLTSFGAGDGQIGIHGTNDSETLGSEVSHGCIRVGNSVIESFARHLPLGTPVRIVS